MKKLLEKKSLLIFGAILLVYGILFTLLKTGVIGAYYEGIILLTFINIILAVSLNLIVGFTGQLCLGHAGFMAIGAYISAIISTKANLPFFLAIIVGAIVSAFFAALIGFPTLRLTGDYFAITTLAFCEIIREMLAAEA